MEDCLEVYQYRNMYFRKISIAIECTNSHGCNNYFTKLTLLWAVSCALPDFLLQILVTPFV